MDDYKSGAFPDTWELVLRDVLKRAEDYWLDDVGVSYVSQQAETIVADLLSKAGLSVVAGTTSFTVGDVAPAEFKLISVLEAAQQIAALIGWKLWAGPDGTVYFQYRKPRPSSTPAWTYQYGRNVLSLNKYDVTDKDLRNRIVVIGYVDPATATPIRSVAYASSPFTTFYRNAILSSQLIDTQAMADTIAGWTLIDLNSLCYVYEFDCVGNPQIDIGSTINVYDNLHNVHGNFMVFSIHSDQDGNQGTFTYHIQSVRWDNDTVPNYEPQPTPEPPPPEPIPPPINPGANGKGNLAYFTTHKGLAKVIGAYDYAHLVGTELLGTGTWTVGAGWTQSPAGTFAHSAGTATLVNSAPILSATRYRIRYTVTGRTAGAFEIDIGGQTLLALQVSDVFDVVTTSTAAFTIIPDNGFDGTISGITLEQVLAPVPVWTNLSATRIPTTTGTISQSGTTITGSGTAFLTEVVAGDRIVAVGIDGNVTLVTDNVTLTIDSSATAGSASFTIFRPLAGLVPAALIIRWFNLDPFGVSSSHFGSGWAMTDDGLYRVTGLPDAPVWTKQLSNADATTLCGESVVLSWQFTPSVRKPGFIMIGATNNTYKYKTYVLYSTDYGVTWQTDAADFMISTTIQVDAQGRLQPISSVHLDDMYYWAGQMDWRGDQDHSPDFSNPSPIIFKGAGMPKFTPGLGYTGYEGRRFFMPYCDNAGVVYPNDNVAYIWRESSGVDSIERVSDAFTIPWSSGYTPPSKVSVGDAAMPGTILWLFSSTLNEDVAVAIDATNIWFTRNLTNASPTWTRVNLPYISRHGLTPTYMFLIPSDENVVFFTGSATGSIAMPCLTLDFGLSLVDLSLYGEDGAFTGVMGVFTGNDMTDSEVLVDYYSETGIVPSAGNGIDVSHYQGAMNWATAKAAGISFAFIKASEGTTITDSEFSANWAGALAAGVMRGAYHYLVTGVDPAAQAAHFLSVLGTDHGELHMAVDCEDTLHGTETSANIKTFLDAIEAALGYKPTIYTGKWWWDNASYRSGTATWASGYSLWIASYTPTPILPSDWLTAGYNFWQYSSSGNGPSYGAIPGDIDLDVAK